MDFDPYKITVEEFENIFSTDAQARDFFERIRWGGHPVCPHCGSFKAYPNGCGTRYKCASCTKKYSVSVKSLLNYSKISLKTWLMAVYLFQKSRRQLLTIALSSILEVQDQTAYMIKKRLEMIFEPIERGDKTGFEVFKEACNNFFQLKDKYVSSVDFKKNFYHIEGDMDISDRSTYDRLLTYTKIRLFYCKYITVSFISPQEVLSEVFIRLADIKDAKRNDGQFLVKLINRTITALWYQYQKTNPSALEDLREYQREWKQDARKNLKAYYVSQIENERLKALGIDSKPSEIRSDNNLMAEVKNRIIEKRKKGVNYGYESQY